MMELFNYGNIDLMNEKWSELLVRRGFSEKLLEDIKKELNSCPKDLKKTINDKKELKQIKKTVKSLKKELSSNTYEWLEEELEEMVDDFNWKSSDQGKYIIEVQDWVQTFYEELRSIPKYEKVYIGAHTERRVVCITGKLQDESDLDGLLEYVESKKPPYKILVKLL